MGVLGLNLPIPTWPIIGDHFPVAFFFILHIAVAEFSLGAITLAAIMETRALRTGRCASAITSGATRACLTGCRAAE